MAVAPSASWGSIVGADPSPKEKGSDPGGYTGSGNQARLADASSTAMPVAANTSLG